MNQSDKSPDAEQRITKQDCWNYIDQEIFVLRDPNYQKQHPIWPGGVGLEIEMFPFRLAPGVPPQSIALQGSHNSLAAYLQSHSEAGWDFQVEDGKLTLVKLEERDFLSFEPGGQLEFSSRPYACLSDAVKRLRSIQLVLEQIGQKHQFKLWQFGINPWHSVEQIGLQMAKPRYKAMNSYFAAIGPYGQQMMRLTGTIQVCLDFGQNQETLVQRFIASQLLSPFATALFAYSPCLEQQRTPFKSYRSHIWQNLDNLRTGYVLQGLSPSSSKQECVDRYLQFALSAPVVYIPQLDFKVPQGLNFSQWLEHGYQGVFPGMMDFMNHLTLLFPEVRPKGFLELRSIDCQARPWQIVPASFVCGLLYDDGNLHWMLEFLEKKIPRLKQIAIDASHGLDNPEIASVCQSLMEKAIAGFSRLPPCFQGEYAKEDLVLYHELFTSRALTPADSVLQQLEAGEALTLDLYRKLESHWMALQDKA